MSDRLHLIHCEKFLKRIQDYTKGGRAAFMAGRVEQDAVLWNLEMISLCARRVSEQERMMHPDVDWDRLRGLCKGLVDQELRPDIERAWQIVQDDVALLQHQLRMLLTAKT